jgi:superfamily II DNA/RNA helicase
MTKFSDLALDPRVLQAVSEAGYETPTPIQAEAIPTRCKAATCWASPRPAPARPPASRCR